MYVLVLERYFVHCGGSSFYNREPLVHRTLVIFFEMIKKTTGLEGNELPRRHISTLGRLFSAKALWTERATNAHSQNFLHEAAMLTPVETAL